MYTANVYNVMIASPSDVQEEREIARRIILEWNDQHSISKKLVLLPLGWEYNSAPSSGARGQEIINIQLLNHADLLIAIFWTKIGTPTENYQSGTIEEIQKHIAAGKNAMLYFSKKGIDPNKVDSTQLEGVKNAKKEFQNNALYGEFETSFDFENIFRKHLSIVVNLNFKEFNFSEQNNVFFTDNKALSEKAQNLLVSAANAKSSEIIKVGYKGGQTIQVDQINFTKNSDARMNAQWEAAFDELIDNGLIRNIGGNIFPVSDKGFQLADSLKAKV